MNTVWSRDIRYIYINSNQIPSQGGVYIVLRNDAVPGEFTNIYVGKAANLNNRYLQHINEFEKNTCLRNNILQNECYFRYVLIPDENTRDVTERRLLQRTWECNIQQQ